MKRTVDVVTVIKRKTEIKKTPDLPEIPEVPALPEMSTLLECDAAKFRIGSMKSSLLNWVNRPNMPSYWVEGASVALAKIEESLRAIDVARGSIIKSTRPSATGKKNPRREHSPDDLSWISYPKWAETEDQQRFVVNVELDKAQLKNALRAAICAAFSANCDDVLDAIETVHEGFLDPAFFRVGGGCGMSIESLPALCDEASAVALTLACEDRRTESDTVHRLVDKSKDLDRECDIWQQKYVEERDKNTDLTRWSWETRGRGVSLCRGGIGVVSVWHDDRGWCLRWLDDGQLIDRIVDEAAARRTAEQIARSRGLLGAGEVVA